MTHRSWWHTNSTASNSRERRYGRLWNEDRFREDMLAGNVDLTLPAFALSNKYDISERAIKRILKERKTGE
jgi:hypothetical protein